MKKQIFDMYDKIPEGVDINSIDSEMEIDSMDIKKAVISKINSEKAKKKVGFSKKLAITLIAAAVGITVLGTVGVGAMGGFNQAFGERFSGEKVNGIYSGGNVNIKTNDNVKAELLGIAGDNNKVMAAVTVKKADGKPFVDYDDFENTIVTPSMYMDCLDENGEVSEQLPFVLTNNAMDEMGSDEYIKATTSSWTNLQFNFDSEQHYITVPDGNGQVHNACIDTTDYDMRMTDSGSVKMIYYIGRDYYSLIGETMNVKQNNIYILHKDKVLLENAVDIRIFDENGEIKDKYDHFTEVLNEEIETVKAHKNTLKDNQTIIAVTDRDPSVQNYNQKDSIIVKRTLYVVTVDEAEINLEGSWQLNYKPTEIQLEAADNLSFQGVDFKINQIKAGSLGTEITISTEKDLSSYYNDNNLINDWIGGIWKSDIEITMKNGEKIKGISYCDTYDTSKFEEVENGTSFTMQIAYYRYNDYNNLTVWSSLNAEEIQSITIDGIEILK